MTEYIVLIVLTFISAIWDLKYKKIPNMIVFSGMAIGLVFSTEKGLVLEHLMGLGILFGVSFLVYSLLRHLIGMGDMKLLMMCEAFMGLIPAFYIFMLSQILLLLYVLIKGKRKQVWSGLKSIAFYRTMPVGSEKYSLGIFFLAATCIYLGCVLWKGAL